MLVFMGCHSNDWGSRVLAFSGGEHPLVDIGRSWTLELFRVASRGGQLCPHILSKLFSEPRFCTDFCRSKSHGRIRQLGPKSEVIGLQHEMS
jgi:hypothetical protein